MSEGIGGDWSWQKAALQEQIYAVAAEWQRPSVVRKAQIFQDGDMWCCLLGPNIQEGVCAFGRTPAEAALNFDFYAWLGKEPPPQPEGKP